MFAYLGSIQIGIDVFTGPTHATETSKSTFAKINVAEGKPVLQDMGDELNTKKLKFFFDESFCDPEAELAKLEEARATRSPMPWSPGDGSYTGARYVVEAIDVELKKTTEVGRMVRLEAHLHLIEAPVADLGALQSVLAVALGAALGPNVALNVAVRTA